jgi:hypothetical protein
LEYEYCVGKAWRSAVSVAYSCHIVVDGQVAIMDSGPGARGGAGRGRRGEVCACGICLNLSAHMRVRVPAPRCPMSEWRPKLTTHARHTCLARQQANTLSRSLWAPHTATALQRQAGGGLLLLGTSTSTGTTTSLNVISENLRRNTKMSRSTNCQVTVVMSVRRQVAGRRGRRGGDSGEGLCKVDSLVVPALSFFLL